MYGGVAAVIYREEQYFALPLDLNIQDGLAETSQWTQGEPARSDSHVVQMIRNGYEAASSIGSSYMALDRYFLTVPALLWGTKLYKKIRFVLVRSSRGECILVSTDLALDPILIIDSMCFLVMHFWMKRNLIVIILQLVLVFKIFPIPIVRNFHSQVQYIESKNVKHKIWG